MKIAMLGLGKLGLPCAEEISLKHEVIGYDTSKSLAFEPSFKVASSIAEACESADLILIAVPTPHDRDYDGSSPVSHLPVKDFSYSIVQDVLKSIAKVRPKSTVVLISTVLPGTVRSQLAPLLPEGTFIYNPYFIAMGTVREDFLSPEMLPMGTHDGKSRGTEKLLAMYESLGIKAPLALGTWEEAESIKIFYNTFISFKLSFVNMIQDVAVRLGNMNVDVVTQALTMANQRILSPAYMKAGMGDGGPCHPRDNIALRDLSQRFELGYDLFGEIIHSREQQAKNLAKYLASHGNEVGIIGVGFKPGTHLTDGSYSLLVAHYLKELKVQVRLHDPNAGFSDDCSNTKVFLLGHPYEHWQNKFNFNPKSKVIDPWRSAIIPHCEVIEYGNTRRNVH